MRRKNRPGMTVGTWRHRMKCRGVQDWAITSGTGDPTAVDNSPMVR